eukprot:8822828-Ditylum_brightwellii.AAC.1
MRQIKDGKPMMYRGIRMQAKTTLQRVEGHEPVIVKTRIFLALEQLKNACGDGKVQELEEGDDAADYKELWVHLFHSGVGGLKDGSM